MPDSPFGCQVPDRLGPYRVIRRLGEGGMGVVFLAFDEDLGRRVALKWLKQANPTTVERLRQEAHLHARVEHPAVCRLYGVAEHEGWPYLVMQYIDGRTLDAAARDLSLETRLRLLATLADGVHAAHRQGLVHRDLKPGNFLVAVDEAGVHHPFVTDFGLARDESSGTLTEAGMLLGSPAYMAPEQVAGAWVDSRTDVYALGATLFELLTGRPPFAGESSAGILARIQTEDVPSVRSLVSDLPRDLEVIVGTATARDRGRRYPSAAAFRDDLLRFLDGEPILARTPPPWERAALWVRRNPRLASVSAAATVAVLAVGTLWARSELRSSRRADFARRLGEQVAAMDSTSRIAGLRPLHDTQQEMGEIRGRMAGIEAEMRRIGSLGAGPGHYALGRGHLALGDPGQARLHLEKAMAAGYRGPEAAYALGRALAALFRKAREEARAIPSKEQREARLKDLERTLRDPALAHLRAGAAPESRPYAEGLIALCEWRPELARVQATEMIAREATRAMGLQLEAEARIQEANQLGAKGEWGRVLETLESAGEALARAMEELRSEPRLRELECDRRLLVLEAEQKRGALAEARARWAIQGCDEALKADSRSREGLHTRAMVFQRWGEWLMEKGQDPRAVFEQGIAASRLAVSVNPMDAEAYNTLGRCLWRISEFVMEHGGDPRGTLQEGLAAYTRVIELAPASTAGFSNIAILWRLASTYEERQGGDPRPALERAASFHRTCLSLNPGYWSAYNNLAVVHYSKAAWEFDHGMDPGVSVREAAAQFEQALQRNPKSAMSASNLGAAYLIQARHARATGGDPLPGLGLSMGASRRALEIRGAYGAALFNLAQAQRLKADVLLDAHQDPREALEEARAGLKKALALKANDAESHGEVAELALVEARWERQKNRSGDPALRRGETALATAQRLDPGNPALPVLAARLALARGPAQLARGLAAVKSALALNPRHAEALGLEGVLLLVQARRERDPARTRETASRAMATLEAALGINAFLKRELDAPRAEARRLSGLQVR